MAKNNYNNYYYSHFVVFLYVLGYRGRVQCLILVCCDLWHQNVIFSVQCARICTPPSPLHEAIMHSTPKFCNFIIVGFNSSLLWISNHFAICSQKGNDDVGSIQNRRNCTGGCNLQCISSCISLHVLQLPVCISFKRKKMHGILKILLHMKHANISAVIVSLFRNLF